MMLIFFLISSVFCGLRLNKAISDQTSSSSTDDFEFSIPEETFVNDDGSPIYLSVDTEKWLTETYFDPVLDGGFLYIRTDALFYKNKICYVADHSVGLWIFNCSDVDKPQLLSRYESSCGTIMKAALFVDEQEIVYLGCGGTVKIISVNDKRNPVVLSSIKFEKYLSSSLINFFNVIDKNLFLLENEGYDDGIIVIYDVSDSESPVLISKTVVYRPLSMFVKGEYIYTGGRDGRVRVFNATDLSKVHEVGVRYVPTGGSYLEDLKVDDDEKYLYLFKYFYGFRVLDVSNKANPVEVGSYPSSFLQKARQFQLVNNRLYCARDNKGLGVYEVETNPKSPTFVESYIRGEYAAIRIFVAEEDGNTIALTGKPIMKQFIYDHLSSFHVFNVTESLDLLYENGASFGAGTGNGVDSFGGKFVDDGRTFVSPDYSNSYGLTILDVSGKNFFAPVPLSRLEIQNIGHFIEENWYYACYSQAGLTIVNTTDRRNPNVVGNVPKTILSYCDSVVVRNNLAYVGRREEGLSIVDVSNKTHPVMLGTTNQSICGTHPFLNIEDGIDDIEVMYATCQSEGNFLAINVSNSSNPFVIKESIINFPFALGFVISGDYAFIAAGLSGVKVLDISNVSNPKVVSDIGTFNSKYIDIEGNHAYVLEYDDSSDTFFLNIIGVADPLNPRFEAELLKVTSSYCGSIEFTRRMSSRKNYVFVPVGSTGLALMRSKVGVQSSSHFSSLCGRTEVKVTAEDHNGMAQTSFWVNREGYCNSHGTCLPQYQCECFERYYGDSCNKWQCDGIESTRVSEVCSGNGDCVSPNKCECRGSFSGEKCSTNMLYYTVMTPVLGSFTVISVILVLILSCCCCICVCVSLLICFSLLICCSSYLFCTVKKQTKGLKRFGKLRDFDLLLKEQEMEDDMSIAHLRISKELFQIEYDELTLVRILGEGGSNSTVFEASWNDRTVAFKSFRTRSVCSSQTSFDEFEREVQILGSVSHPNILRFYGCCLQPPRIGIVMEFCSKGDLVVFLRRKLEEGEGGMSFESKCRICVEICLAMSYLHARSIIHRDLKLENVLVDQNESTRVMDFGLSRIVQNMTQENKTKKIGTSIYMSPEVVFSGHYNQKVDVYAFGICAYIIFSEEFYPYGIDATAIEMRVANDPNLRPDIKKLFPVLSSQTQKEEEENEFSWLIDDVIQKSWSHNPKERLSFQKIVDVFKKNSSFMRKGDDDGSNEKDVSNKKEVQKEDPGIDEEDHVTSITETKSANEESKNLLKSEEIRSENEELKKELERLFSQMESEFSERDGEIQVLEERVKTLKKERE